MNANEVRVTFFTTDKNNRPVETIGKDDFAIVDGDNIVRDFRSLTRSNETAVRVIVLVDTSESVAPYFGKIIGNVLSFTSQETAGLDNLSVLSFSGLKPVTLCASNCRGPQLERTLLKLQPSSSTPLFDTLGYAAHSISAHHTDGVRDVVILFSDGDDNISAASARDAVAAVMDSGALLYTVNTGKFANTPGALTLQQLADATGGRSLSTQENSASILQSILADLRASYVVTYALPQTSTGFRSLRILPKHNLNLRFHSRRGYNYEEIR